MAYDGNSRNNPPVDHPCPAGMSDQQVYANSNALLMMLICADL